jgi:hypothetical protein
MLRPLRHPPAAGLLRLEILGRRHMRRRRCRVRPTQLDSVFVAVPVQQVRRPGAGRQRARQRTDDPPHAERAPSSRRFLHRGHNGSGRAAFRRRAA